MITIWKYPIHNLGPTHLKMPKGAVILSVGVQRGDLFLWARVNTDNPLVERIVRSEFTGSLAISPVHARFIGTVENPEGLVSHIFDAEETKS